MAASTEAATKAQAKVKARKPRERVLKGERKKERRKKEKEVRKKEMKKNEGLEGGGGGGGVHEQMRAISGLVGELVSWIGCCGQGRPKRMHRDRPPLTLGQIDREWDSKPLAPPIPRSP